MVKFGGFLGFDNGIMVAPMGRDIAGPELAAAVSNAGGIGSFAAPINNYGLTKELIAATRILTDKPFGVGVLLEFENSESIQAIYDEGVAFLHVFWGEFPKERVDEAHRYGVKVFHQIGSLEEAEKAIAAGVDAIIAQGVEAGGHLRGTIGGIALIPRIVDLIGERDIPVIAAGAMNDPRCYVAALALGAKGISVGTRFVASEECYAHEYYKKQLLNYTEADTDRTDLYGRSSWVAYARVLNTPFHQQWKDYPEYVKDDESQPIIGTSIIHGQEMTLRRFSARAPNPTAKGELENMVMYSGQGIGLVTEILPAGKIVQDMVTGAVGILNKLKDSFLDAC